MLYPYPLLNDVDQSVLAGIDEMRHKLRDRLRTGPPEQMRWLGRYLTAQAVSGSNRIEGFRVSTEHVKDLIDGDSVMSISVENREETVAYLRMIAYVQTLRSVSDFEYSKGMLNGLHMIAREGLIAPEFSSIEAWLGRPGNTAHYYKELQRRGPIFQPDQDILGWIRLNLTAHHQRIHEVWNLLERSVAVSDLLLSFAEERAVAALHDVAMIGRVRSVRFQRFPRDLRDLKTAGLLAESNTRMSGPRYYVEGPNFPAQVLEVARTPMTLSQPYPDALG